MFRSLAKYHTQDCLAVQIFTYLKFLKLKSKRASLVKHTFLCTLGVSSMVSYGTLLRSYGNSCRLSTVCLRLIVAMPLIAPVVVLPLLSRRHHLLSSCCAAYTTQQQHLCLATLHLRLPSRHHLLFAGASPPVYLSFTGWLSCHILSRCCLTLTCPSLTLAFMRTGWLSCRISLHCPRCAGESPPFCLSFAPTGCLCV